MSVYVILVGFRKEISDPLGESVKEKIRNLGICVDSVRIIDVYTIDSELDRSNIEMLRKELFTDPIVQDSSVDKWLSDEFDVMVWVSFKPGVTDNVGKTSSEAIFDATGKKAYVYTSKQYLIKGKISDEDIKKISEKILCNPLIENYKIIKKESFGKSGVDKILPKVNLKDEIKVSEIDLNVSDKKLMEISAERVLALNLNEMKKISLYYKNEKILEERKKYGLSGKPTDVELEAIAQTWSEHCKHKIFNAEIHYTENGKTEKIDSLFKTYIFRATEEIRKKLGEKVGKKDYLVSVFSDNAGIIKFNDKWNFVMKVETHNAPSALDPYGGALTGIVGVNRDVLGTGLGAKPIFNTDVLCFASPFYDKEIPGKILHPKRIFDGVTKGIEHGGNKSGIPTINGCIVFDDRFLGKPLVFCGTGGIMPSEINGRKSHIKNISPGDLIVVVGGRTGKDGIHGATFSSESLNESSPSSAVQIGDPITQKKMSDFLLEARDLGLYEAITDNGAGGLSSSVGEMASICGGCEIDLKKVPLKYEGLSPWEILLSESQERMTVSVSAEKIKEFERLAKEREVEVSVIGKFTNSGKFHVLYGERTVAYIDMEFLHNGVPKMKLFGEWKEKKLEEPNINPEDLGSTLKKILSRLNVCSKEYVIRQYDHEVQGGSVLKPLSGIKNDGPSDAAVIRPLIDSDEGLIVANGICPKYSDIDTYYMALCAVDEAIRNIIASGGNLDCIVFNDNFCWPSPLNDSYKTAQLVRACKGIYDASTYFLTPFISGKDSMSIDYIVSENGKIRKISGPPTLLISAVCVIKDVNKVVSIDVKSPGDIVYVVGITKDELGGSEYYAMNGFLGKNVPKVDLKMAKKIYEALSKAIEEGTVASCHDCSDGGLGVALAESAFSGGFGMTIYLKNVPRDPELKADDKILFSESQSRFVVTVPADKKKKFESIMSLMSLEKNVFGEVGFVREDKIFVVYGLSGKEIINENIDDLKESWKKTLRW